MQEEVKGEHGGGTGRLVTDMVLNDCQLHELEKSINEMTKMLHKLKSSLCPSDHLWQQNQKILGAVAFLLW